MGRVEQYHRDPGLYGCCLGLRQRQEVRLSFRVNGGRQGKVKSEDHKVKLGKQ